MIVIDPKFRNYNAHISLVINVSVAILIKNVHPKIAKARLGHVHKKKKVSKKVLLFLLKNS